MCGFFEPLTTAGDRRCPCETVATGTQSGPSGKIHRLRALHDGAAPRAGGLRAEGALSTMRTMEASRDAEGHLAWH
jgi:hypothetical protein